MADAAVAGERAAVFGIGGDAGDGGNLAAVGAAEFGERRQQENGGFFGNAFDGDDFVESFGERRVVFDDVEAFLVQAFDFLFQIGDVSDDFFFISGGRLGAVLRFFLKEHGFEVGYPFGYGFQV